MKQRHKHLDDREARRLRTTRQRHGDDFFIKNGHKAGKLSTTKFNRDSAKLAAQRRWAKVRAAKRNLEKGE